jgi:hypothetical protein
MKFRCRVQYTYPTCVPPDQASLELLQAPYRWRHACFSDLKQQLHMEAQSGAYVPLYDTGLGD